MIGVEEVCKIADTRLWIRGLSYWGNNRAEGKGEGFFTHLLLIFGKDGKYGLCYYTCFEPEDQQKHQPIFQMSFHPMWGPKKAFAKAHNYLFERDLLSIMIDWPKRIPKVQSSLTELGLWFKHHEEVVTIERNYMKVGGFVDRKLELHASTNPIVLHLARLQALVFAEQTSGKPGRDRESYILLSRRLGSTIEFLHQYQVG